MKGVGKYEDAKYNDFFILISQIIEMQIYTVGARLWNLSN